MVDFRFSIVPDWIVQLHMLKSLEVQVVSLSRHGVEVLTGLTSLVHLRLIVENDVPEEGIIMSSTSFMNLKEFSFRHNGPCLTFEAGTMPRLERLLIECKDPGVQPDDGSILTGIEYLGSLKVFKVDILTYFDMYVESQWMRMRRSNLFFQRLPGRAETLKRKGGPGGYLLKDALRKAISRHPGSPDIYIQSLPDRVEASRA